MGWLQQLFSRRRRYDELSASIREHLDEKIADFMDRGMTREQAERTARRAFGNVTRIEERSREVWQWPTIESVYADIKFALRQLLRSPGFAVVSVLTIALGIGATTAVFSVIDAVIFRPLPYSQPALLVDADATTRNNISSARNSLSYPDFFDWRTQNKTLEQLVSYHDSSYTLTGLGRPLHVDAEVTSWDLVPTLGVTPEIGRGFTSNEEKQGSNVVLISHELWATQFNSDRSIIGRVIHLSGNSFTVVGVMPATFRFPVTEPQISIWTTLAVDSEPNEQNSPTRDRNNHFLNAIGRMKPSSTVAQVSEDLDAIAKNLAKQYPNSNTLYNAAKAQPELNSLLGGVRTELLVVQGTVILILLIACGNIANLLLSRVRERQREIAMRSALAAGRWRIVRQLLIESLVLSAVGGIAGIGLALACTPIILLLIGDSIPRAANAGVNSRVLVFSTVVSLTVGLIFGIIPAITASRENLVASLKGGGRSGTSSHDGIRSFLIVGQVAIGMIVITVAGLLGTSFMNLIRTNQGFNPDHILTFFFDLPDSTYKDIRQNFYRQYFDRLETLPGVQSVAGVMILPMNHDSATTSFQDPEHPVPQAQQPAVDINLVTPKYFRTMQIPFLKGRPFSDRDDGKAPPVMIVNQAFAQKYFPGQEILGKELKPGGPHLREIVGIVGNIRLEATQSGPRPSMYIPDAQWKNDCCLYTVMRTSIEPETLEPTVRQLVASMDNETPIVQVRTMKELMSTELSQPRFAMVLVGAFAGIAIILAVVGLYGVMMYSVSRRTREIGVRMALGASRRSVLNMILRNAAILLGSGIAIGLVVSLASASVLQSMLYGTGVHNPVVLTLVSVMMGVAGFIAAYVPAFRAASIDPIEALRIE